MTKYDPVKFCGELKHETDGAYLVSDGINDIWLPKSQVREFRQVGRRGSDYEFVIPEWLAIEKGVI